MHESPQQSSSALGLFHRLMSDNEVPTRYRQSVFAGQIRYVYDAIPGTIFVSVAVFSIIFFLFRNIIPLTTLVWWFIAVIMVYSLHYSFYLKYRKKVIPDDEIGYWGNIILLCIGLEGVVWGYAGVSFFSWEYPQVSMLLSLALAGSVAASFNTHSAYFPAYVIFSVFTVFPLAIRLLIEGGENNIILALFCIFFILALLLDAVVAHRHFKRAIVAKLKVQELNIEIDEERRIADEAREEAERANIAKSKFLASASHDLRQPLYSLRLFVDILNKKITDQSITPILNNINTVSSSLEDLFNKLLDLSKLDAQVLHAENMVFPLNQLFVRLKQEFSPLAAEKNLIMDVMKTSIVVNTDMVLLERVLRNLISNAIRYTDKGTIILGCRRRGDFVAIQIVDSGIGIPEDQIASIFKEYHQLNNPERDRTKGLGLGLAIASGMARVMGTSIEVQSVEGRGSIFSIEIPIHSESYINEEEKLEQKQDHSIEGRRILFIDDDEVIRIAMDELFNNWGCDSLIALNLEDALLKLENRGWVPEVLITDYRLPRNQTGTDVINAIRERFGQDLPSIIITGDTAPDRIRDAKKTGAHLIHKPAKSERIFQLLVSILN